MLHQDTIAGAVLLFFCAVVFWLTTGFSDPPSMLSQNVPPTFFPRLVLAAIAVLSIGLMIVGLRSKPLPSAAIAPTVRVTAILVLLAGLAVTVLGTLLTLACVAALLPLSWKERRWELIAPLVVGLPIAIYLIFSLLLDVRFPVGMLFEAIL